MFRMILAIILACAWSTVGHATTRSLQTDFGTVCDILLFSGSATWSAGGTTFTPNNGITPVPADSNKKVVVYGAGIGGATYVGTITGVSGNAWTVSLSLVHWLRRKVQATG